ncbi:C-C chemokine receptor type 9-like [Arapaima gigas]
MCATCRVIDPAEDDETTEYLEYICDKTKVREFRSQYEPPLYWLIVILGAFGNLLVVWIYIHFRNRLKTMTDVYLLNLAIADLLFLGTLPFWAADAAYGWTFGTGLCRVVSAIYKINFFSSMLLLTCISLDRYVAVVRATKVQNSKRKRVIQSKLICIGVWVLALALATPEFLFAKVRDNYDGNKFCSMVFWNNENNHTKILVLSLQICIGFCLPFLVMFFCYTIIIHTLLQTKNFEKHKAMRVIFAVVAVFVISQLPYNSVLVVEATQAANITMTECDKVLKFDIASQVLKSLAYTHSCLNPFLYAFIGVRFRKDLLKVFQSFCCCLSSDKLSKLSGGSKRPSIMSDTETTPALSL